MAFNQARLVAISNDTYLCFLYSVIIHTITSSYVTSVWATLSGFQLNPAGLGHKWGLLTLLLAHICKNPIQIVNSLIP